MTTDGVLAADLIDRDGPYGDWADEWVAGGEDTEKEDP